MYIFNISVVCRNVQFQRFTLATRLKFVTLFRRHWSHGVVNLSCFSVQTVVGKHRGDFVYYSRAEVTANFGVNSLHFINR